MIRIGIIGCGGIGKHHQPLISQIPGTTVTAVCDLIPRRVERLAARTGGKAYADYRDLIPEVDVAWVCTPEYTHDQITLDLLRAGKHVFCEKAMALTLDKADAMAAEAEKRGLVLAIGYCLRFSDWSKKVKEVVESGVLGELTKLWVTRMCYFPGPDWYGKQELSGGMVTSQLTHNLDLMRYWAGEEVDWVVATGQTVTPDVTIFDNVSAMMKFESGVTGQAMTSWSCGASWIEHGILGTKAVLRTGQVSAIEVAPIGGEPYTVAYDGADPYLAEDMEFIACVREGRRYPLPLSEARASLALGFAIEEAARSGEKVYLGNQTSI